MKNNYWRFKAFAVVLLFYICSASFVISVNASELYPSAYFNSVASPPSVSIFNNSENTIFLNIGFGSIEITTDSSNMLTIDYYDSVGSKSVYSDLDISSTKIFISGLSDESSVTVSGNCNIPINIILDNLRIDRSGQSAGYAFSIRGSAKVSLLLTGQNVLIGAGINAGLEVPQNSEVTIGSLDGNNAELFAESTGMGAGIGSLSNFINGYPYGKIIINGGKITAKSVSGAGIGSAGGVNDSAVDGEIIINGGIIEACSDGYGAGIGGGRSRAGGNITINGGTVTAYSSEDKIGYGAGIGGGSDSPGGTIKITGGVINAYSSKLNAGGGAGIGGGQSGSSGNIIIEGGTINAFSSLSGVSRGSGIGNGENAILGGRIEIYGGSVNARGNDTEKPIIPNPTNNGDDIYLSVLFINAETAEAAVTGGTIDDIRLTTEPGNDGFCIRDVKTDSEGKLYFWLLPSDDSERTVSLIIDGIRYSLTYSRAAGASYLKTLDDSLKGNAEIIIAGEGILRINEVLSAGIGNLNVRTKLNFEWTIGDLTIGTENEIFILPNYAGSEIKLFITSEDVAGIAQESIFVPYTVKLGDITGSEQEDSVNLTETYKNPGESVEISYSMSNLASTNRIEFTPGSIGSINQSGIGSIEYITNADDSENGVIQINACFTHINEIHEADFLLSPPVKGEAPQTIIANENEYYDVTVSWSENPKIFAPSTVYSAEFTLTAKNRGVFAQDFIPRINNESASILSIDEDMKKIKLSFTFPKTAEPNLISIEVDDDGLSFRDGDIFQPKNIVSTLVFDDGTIKRMRLNELENTMFILSSGNELYPGSVVKYAYDGLHICIEFNGESYNITRAISVYLPPTLSISVTELSHEMAVININVKIGSGGFDSKLQMMVDSDWVDIAGTEISGSTSDRSLTKTIHGLSEKTTYEFRLWVKDNKVNEVYLSTVGFMTTEDLTHENNHEEPVEQPEEPIKNPDDPKEHEENQTDIENSDNHVPENSGDAENHYETKNNPLPETTDFSDLRDMPPLPVDTKNEPKSNVEIPQKRNGNVVSFDITKSILQELISGGNKIDLDFSYIKTTSRDIIEVYFETVPQVDNLSIRLPSDIILSLPKDVLDELAKTGEKIGIVFKPNNISFELNVAGTPVNIYSFENPFLVSIPYNLNDTLSVFVDMKNRNIIPRSWYENGRMYAKIYSPGTYRPEQRIPTSFKDSNNTQSNEILNYLSARSIVYGIGDGKFEPGREIKYSELIAMIMRFYNIKMPADEIVAIGSDITGDVFYKEDFIKADSIGIIDISEASAKVGDKMAYNEIRELLCMSMLYANITSLHDAKGMYLEFDKLNPDLSYSNSYITRIDAARMVYQMMMFDAKYMFTIEQDIQLSHLSR